MSDKKSKKMERASKSKTKKKVVKKVEEEPVEPKEKKPVAKKEKAKKEKKTKTKKPSKLEVSKKALKAAASTKFHKGSIADDALTELSCYAKQHNLTKEEAMKIMIQAKIAVNGRNAKRIMKRDIEKAINEEKRRSVEY